MEYIGIGIGVVAILIIAAVLYIKFKQKKNEPSELAPIMAEDSIRQELVKIDSSNELIIQMEMLPAEAIEDETKLVEITDSKVLAHINNLVPGLAQAANAANNAAQAVKNGGEVLYVTCYEFKAGKSGRKIPQPDNRHDGGMEPHRRENHPGCHLPTGLQRF